MKKLILLILLLPLLQAKAQTNVYHPLPDSNAVWNFNFHVTCPFGMVADYSIMISGDTILNNLNYKKLYTPHIQLAVGSSPCYFIESNYRGAFRQDTSTKKVYIVSNIILLRNYILILTGMLVIPLLVIYRSLVSCLILLL
jgi:hypothetical protein